MDADNEIKELIKKEGWEIVRVGKEFNVKVYDQLFPFCHPASIHLKLYRTSQNPDIKYQHLNYHDLRIDTPISGPPARSAPPAEGPPSGPPETPAAIYQTRNA